MRKLTFWVVSIPMLLFGIGNSVTVHFSVHDDGGNAVTNAEIKARTRRDRLEFWTHASTPMRETIVQTDTLGGRHGMLSLLQRRLRLFCKCAGFLFRNTSSHPFQDPWRQCGLRTAS